MSETQLNSHQDTILSRPRGVASAYGSVIRETESPRDIEYRVLARTTTMLEQASDGISLAEAVHENRVVWLAFAADLADEGNSWAPETKARLISLAYWVFAESSRVLRDNKPVKALVEVNRSVMQGLKPIAATDTLSQEAQ